MSPEFIEAAEALPDTTYFVSDPNSIPCWLQRPMTIVKHYRWVENPAPKPCWPTRLSNPISVEELAKNINSYFWYHRRVSEGTKGPIAYEFTRCRIVISVEGLPQKSLWLPIRLRLGEYRVRLFHHQCLSALRLNTLVWLSGFAGRLSSALRRPKPNWAWIITKCASSWAGFTTSSRVCWPISSCGT